VLHLQPLVVSLDLPQPLKFTYRLQIQSRDRAPQFAVTSLLAPPRQHERVNAQRLRDVANQDSRLLAELDGSEFELRATCSPKSDPQRV
jgi:hypothetical protein